ncbi:hypothetical protein N9R79_08760 [Vibrio sp.]|nr:hypothetical protein [Vibrio sp.]
MAKPNKKLPSKSISIFCKKCKARLYEYRKGGNGALVKCFKERITRDYTEEAGVCPNCRAQFARETMIRGAPALKMIGGKVHHK